MLELNKDRDTLQTNGIKTSYDFDFYIQKKTDIEYGVYFIDEDGDKTLLTLDSDYTVSSILTSYVSGDAVGFTLNFNTPPAVGSLFVKRTTPKTQTLGLGKTTDLDERKIMGALDKTIAAVQDMSADLARCLKTAEDSNVTGLALPNPLTPNRVFKVGPDGESIVLSEFDPDEVAPETVHEQADIATTKAAEAAASAAQALADKNSISAGLAQLNGIGTLANLSTTAKDTLVNSINEVLTTAQNLANPDIVSLGSVATSFTLQADKIHTAAIVSSVTLSLPTITSTTKVVNCMIDFTLATGKALTLPTVVWPYGVIPTLSTTSGVRNRLIFDTVDNGATWKGFYTQLGA